MNILISAYAVSPFKGSEPGLGWNFITNISKYDHEFIVICEEKEFKSDLDSVELPSNVKFVFVPRLHNKTLHFVFGRIYYYYTYRKWQKSVFRIVKSMASKGLIDVIHQLNMIGFREPGYLWRLNLPFVYGPFGGMQNAPTALIRRIPLKGKYILWTRNIVNTLQFKFMRRPKKAAKVASKYKALYCGYPELSEKINDQWNVKPAIIPDQGFLGESQNHLEQKEFSHPFKLIWVGTLTYNKALNILIDSLERVSSNIEVNVVGDGPAGKFYRRYAKKLKNPIIWHGWLPHSETKSLIGNSHALIHTSLKEAMPTVIFESLSRGTPVICLNHHGQGSVVNNKCGILIEIGSYASVIEGLTEAIDRMARDMNEWKDYSMNSRLRVREYSWKKIAKEVNTIYNQL